MALDDFFEKIDAHHKLGLPFVAYRKPNTELAIAFLQQDKLLYTITDYTESGFVFAPFDDRCDAILIPFKNSAILSFDSQFLQIQFDKSNSSIVKDDRDRVCHMNLVKKGIKAIKNGDLRKVVLSRQERIRFDDAKPLEVFKRLLKKYTSAFVFCFYHPEVGTWLGATPETLLKVEGHKFLTTALAGTQQYKGSLDVVWSEKEKEEQQLVTDYIVDQLQPLAIKFNVEAVKTVKAGGLLHLKTNMSGTLDIDTMTFKQLIYTLHPTPAVCGIPKEKAKKFILEHEKYDREFYTGYLGELNLKTRKINRLGEDTVNDVLADTLTVSNFFVNLRCVQFKVNEAIIYIGGGITKDSNAEAEWEETVNKSKTIKSVL